MFNTSSILLRCKANDKAKRWQTTTERCFLYCGEFTIDLQWISSHLSPSISYIYIFPIINSCLKAEQEKLICDPWLEAATMSSLHLTNVFKSYDGKHFQALRPNVVPWVMLLKQQGFVMLSTNICVAKATLGDHLNYYFRNFHDMPP